MLSIIKNLVLALFLLASTTACAQLNGYLSIFGSTQEQFKPLKDCVVTLFLDSTDNVTQVQKEQLTTKGNSKFKFNLSYNTHYTIQCNRENYGTKTIKINSTVPQNLLLSNLQFEFALDMTASIGMNTPNSITTIYFDNARNAFDYRLE